MEIWFGTRIEINVFPRKYSLAQRLQCQQPACGVYLNFRGSVENYKRSCREVTYWIKQTDQVGGKLKMFVGWELIVMNKG